MAQMRDSDPKQTSYLRDLNQVRWLFLVSAGLLLLITSAALTAFYLHHVKMEEIVAIHNRHTHLASKLRSLAFKRTSLLAEIVSEADPFRVDELAMEHSRAAAEFGKYRQELLHTPYISAEEIMLLQQQQIASDRLYQIQEQIKDLIREGRRDEAAHLLGTIFVPRQQPVLYALDQLLEVNQEEIHGIGSALHTETWRNGILLMVFALVALTLSIAAKRRAERAIAESHQELLGAQAETKALLMDLEYQKKALDEHAIVSIADPAGKIIYANEKFCEISGYSAQELLGKPHSLINSGLHPPVFWRDFWRVISSGRVWHGVVRNKRKDGGYYWVQTTVVPFLGDDGRPYQYVGIRTDISAQKRAEADLEEANRELMLAAEYANFGRDSAVRASKAKTEFLQIMSHEFRTPINAIMGFSEFMLSEHPEGSWEYAQETQYIYEAGQRLLNMINRIFEYIDLEDADLMEDAIPVDIVEIMQQVGNAYQGKAGAKNLNLRVEAQVSKCYCLTDSGRIYGVIRALLDNALEVTEAGEVVLTCRREQRQEGSVSRSQCHVMVRDTGPGVSPEQVANLFESFRQVGADAMTRKHEGVGLTLAISKRIIEGYGGRIWYEPAPEGGAIFHFMLEETTETGH